VWERLAESSAGRRYLSLPEGPLKRLLRPLVRRRLLKGAGFDRCRQLIVGSAPAGESLLRGYHELGIELHNAYGLSEAPLVTLNRLGRNRLGTVGEALPETEIRIAEDGEVLVRGPQVTAGYYNPEDGTPLRDGWLLTGDLGHMTAAGSLVILGRKKELIATSYGKKISPQRVEALLREVPGIDEVMLVGESRPFPAALLWVKDNGHGPASMEAIDRAVRRLNDRLSHAEQVKRWAVLANDLTVEGGDLTANLKLRRQAVSGRLQPVLSALYGAGDAPGAVLHLGRAGTGDAP
jgi:long-chain acyl-CoA synthetase